MAYNDIDNCPSPFDQSQTQNKDEISQEKFFLKNIIF